MEGKNESKGRLKRGPPPKRQQGGAGNGPELAERLSTEAEEESCHSMFFLTTKGKTTSKTQGYYFQGTDLFSKCF